MSPPRLEELPRLPVAVIVPALNRAATLPRCLASVWSQRPHLPEEVIVIDDGSHDETAAVAAELGARVIRHSEQRGLAAARNSGLHATDCEWVALLDSDDEWLPHHLAHLDHLRDGHALVGSSALWCGEDPSRDRFHGPTGRRPVVLRSPERLIATHNLFTASACMIRRDVAVELRGFRPVWGVEDLDLWVRTLEHHTAICSPRVTVIYHVHAEQMSSQPERLLHGHREVGEDHRRRTGGSPVALRRWEGVAAWDTLRAAVATGDRWAALRSSCALLAGRQRMTGLILLLWSRFCSRRVSATVARDGTVSVAVLVRDAGPHDAVIDSLRGRLIRDLSHTSTARTMVTLARRPAGVAVVGSRRQAVLSRLTGTPAVSAQVLLDGEAMRSDGRSESRARPPGGRRSGR